MEHIVKTPNLDIVRRSENSRIKSNGKANKLDFQDRAFHDWYRFVLSYPPHLVQDYINDFQLNQNSLLLDPFCGTGTTLVAGKLMGIRTVGLEANPIAHFASSVKLEWGIDPDLLLSECRDVAYTALELLNLQRIDDNQPFEKRATIKLRALSADAEKLILTNSISSLPLHKTLILLD